MCARDIMTTPGEGLHERIYVLVSMGGFIGAYTDMERAVAFADEYPSLPFLMYTFPRQPTGATDKVWVILYRGCDAIAFVSNDRPTAEAKRRELATVGLAYDDDLDYWEQPLDSIPEITCAKLRTMHKLNVEQSIKGCLNIMDSVIPSPPV